ncbi:hypothetical protein Tco_1155365 [Tanacetum coccineum]
MSTTDKESSAAGTDNRPPMLKESDFESWKIRIEMFHCWEKVNTNSSDREKIDERVQEAENNKRDVLTFKLTNS